MIKSLTKYSTVFFSASDEETFSKLLREIVPDLCWVDGSKGVDLVIHDSPKACRSGVIFPWSPSLKHLTRPGFDGPRSGLKVQLCRCSVRDGNLQDGSFSAGYREDDMATTEYVQIIWRILRSMNSATLTSYDSTGTQVMCEGISDCIVGPDAAEFASESPLLAAGIVRYKAVKKELKKKAAKK